MAYTPRNEPHPERALGFEEPGDKAFAEWRAKAKGMPADLDASTAEWWPRSGAPTPTHRSCSTGWFYASPPAWSLLEPIEAKGILYAFHFYDPWEYSTFRVNQGRWSYPERMPGPGGKAVRGGADTMRERVAPVARWALAPRSSDEPDRGRRVRRGSPVSAARSRTSTTWCAC